MLKDEKENLNNNNITKLENLLLSEELEELNNKTKTFNIFNALKLENNEIRHSNFLGWLMAPYETHGLDDYFLKEFLKSAIKDFSTSKETEVALHNIVFSNFDDTEIKREYKNIDLLLISPQNKFVCIVENKIWTGEHDCQLERYADIINKEFKEYRKLYIYLAPVQSDENSLIERTCGTQTKATVHYIPMTYEQVYNVLDRTLRFKDKQLSQEVKIFIEHYKKMLERNIMGNTDEKVVELCKKIYREHKEAINLIIENNNPKAELWEILKTIVNNRDDLQEITIEKNNSIICLPKNIKDIEKLRFGEWTKDIIVYLHFMNMSFGHKDTCLEILVGPAKDEASNTKRQNLIEHIAKELNLKFNGHGKGKTAWNFTSPCSIISINEFEKMNSDDLNSYMSEKINEAKDIYIDKLANAINSAIDKGLLD